tara:strand:+ start:256 stop:489 length:234 start_codon:yes stop_codon:yes gene_type:complete
MKKSKLEEQNDKFATTYFDESLGLEVYMTEEPPKDQQEQDMIYLDKIGRKIETTCFFFLGLTMLGFVYILSVLSSHG